MSTPCITTSTGQRDALSPCATARNSNKCPFQRGSDRATRLASDRSVWATRPPGFIWGLALMLMLATQLPVLAGIPYTWTGLSTTSWTDNGSWSPSGYPGPGDTAVFPGGLTGAQSSLGLGSPQTVDAMTFNIDQEFDIGAYGNYYLFIGGMSGSSFTQNGTGSAIISSDVTCTTPCTLGGTGSGSVNFTGAFLGNPDLIMNGGTYNIGSGHVVNGQFADPLNLQSITVNGGTLSLGVSNVVTVSGAVIVNNGGTLRLCPQNYYPIPGTFSAGSLTVNAGGILYGRATVASGTPTTFASGSTINPGCSPGTLSFGGGLTLSTGTILNYELDTPGVVGSGVNDLIDVTGDLTLAGTLNVTAYPNFGVGPYRLFDYTGVLSGPGLVLGSLPAGYFYSIDTSIAGQVNLIVSQSNSMNLQPGYNFIVNPVNGNGGNNVNNPLFLQIPSSFSDPNGLNNAVLYVWNCTNFTTYQYYDDADSGGIPGWYDYFGNLANNVIWNSGQGMILYNPVGATTLTFGGSVPVLTVPTPLPCGCGQYNLLGNLTGGPGTYDNVIGLAPQPGAQVLRYIPGQPVSPVQAPNYSVYTFTGGSWSPSAPVLTNNEAAWFLVPCVTNNCITLTYPSNNIVTTACASVRVNYTVRAVDTCCSNVTVVCTPPSNSVFAVGTTTTVSCVATDLCGNTLTKAFTVTVTPRSFQVNCPANKSVACNTAWNFNAPTFSSCCSNTLVRSLGITTNGICPKFITQTWSITDACGDSNVCSQTITVTSAPPVVICATNKTIPCSSNMVFDLPTVIPSCLCTNYSINIFGNDVTTNVAGSPCSQITTRTWLITDCCGYSNYCSQTITVAPASSYTVTLQLGLNLIANQLDNLSGDSAAVLFPNGGAQRDGDELLLWVCGTGYVTYYFDSGSPTGFDDQNFNPVPAPIITPGMGVFYNNQTGVPEAVTFSGTPRCPAPAATLCPCSTYSLVSYELDCFGTYQNITGLSPQEGAQVSRWNGTGLTTYTFTSGAWDPSTPVLNVGEAAFVLAPCPTNVCITLTCATNKTVPCGTGWSFDAPTNIVDQCCTNYSLTFTTATNSSPCPLTVTRTWTVADTCGHTTNCSQTVSVINTNAPVMSNPTNKTVACGSAWSFTTPTASDPCGGANILVTALTPVTNGSCPKIITETWVATNLCNGLTATVSQVVTAVACVPPPAGMVGWWPGDNNANDLSSYGNTATLQSGALYAPGMVSTAFSFPAASANASVSVATPVAGSLDFGSAVPFSIDAWINTTSTGIAAIVDKRSGNGNQGNTFGYSFFVYGGHLGFQLGSGSYGNYISAGPTINDGRWHFVAATVNRATKQILLYVDNTLVLTANTTAVEGNVSNSGAFLIGQGNLSGPGAFSGLIDEVEVFNRVLGATDIATIYNAGPAGKCKSPKLVCPNPYSIPCTQQLFIFNPPTINDPCGCAGNQTVNQFGSDVTGGTACARTFTRTWVYVDCCGNSNFCNQTVTITNVPPVIVQAPTGANLGCNPTFLPTDSSIKAQVRTTLGCSLTTNVTHVDTGTPCAMSRLFNINVTDACGNYSQTSMTYTWKNDTTPPVLHCLNKTVLVPLNKDCTLTIPKITGITATDNCTPASQMQPGQYPPKGSIVPGPNATVTVTYTDACGNSSHCTVTVQGTSKGGPVLTVPASLTVSNCLVPCVSNLVSVTGGCCPPGSIKITQSPACDTEIGPGISSITVTATDCNGNVSKKTIKLVVLAPGSFLSSLYNTGTDENHAVIAFGLLDYHYALAVPNGVTTCYPGNAMAVKGPWTLWPYPPTGSDWIAPCINPFNTNSSTMPTGYYTYTYSFLLPPGSDPNTASISGRWAANQWGYASINGNSYGSPYGMSIPPNSNGAGQWQPFTINAGFHAGVNTITWSIYSRNNPNGLRVEYTSATVCSTCAPPTIASITSGHSIPNNGIGALSVAVSGTQPMTYQWYFNNTKLQNGSPYYNVDTANLLISPVHYANAGLYTVIISNGCGSVTGKVQVAVSLGFPWNWASWNMAQLDYPLAAAFGPDLNLVGTSDYGTNYTLTAGTTDDFGLPTVGGQIANVMHVAPLPADTSIQIPQITPAGSNSLNSYSVIMDLYEPDTAWGTPSILFKNSCCLGSSGQDGVALTLDAQNYLHLSGYAAGAPFDIASITPTPTNTWTRLAMIIDDPQDGVGITVSFYEDGQQLGSQFVAMPTGLPINWTNSAPTLLSRQTTDTSLNADFFVAGIQFHAVALTAEQIAGMGSPDTGVMPADETAVGPQPTLNATSSNGVVNLSWTGSPYVLQETTSLTSGEWVDSALPLLESLDGTQTVAVADPSVEGPIKFYRLIFRP